MATYAAYRHVELDHVGYGKKRVLKPPGGGSSDIFGLGGGDPQQSPRKVKQYMASNISLTDGGVAAPSGTGPGSTSSAASTASSGETPSPGSPSGSPARNDGNPVTGEGYKSASGPASGAAAARNRVPPGGYSSGLW